MINVSRSAGIQGWMTLHELEWLAAQAAEATLIAELGCWKGRSTAALVDHTPGTVWTIDNWAGACDPTDASSQEIRSLGSSAPIRGGFLDGFGAELEATKLRLVEMDSVAGVEHLLETVGRRFDFIFIDGEHGYDHVLADIRACLKILLPGGLISGHDFWMAGVGKAVGEMFKSYQRPVDSIWSVRVQ